MKRLIILTLTILLSSNSYSQAVFQKKMDLPTSVNGQLVISDPVNQFIVASEGFANYYIKLNDNFDILSLKKIVRNGGGVLINSFLNSKGVTSGGQIKLLHAGYDTGAKIVLAESNDFSIVWSKSHSCDTTYFNEAFQQSKMLFSRQFSNDKWAFVGDNFTTNLSPIVMLFDTAGNHIWSKQYKLASYEIAPNQIVERANDYLLVGAISQNTMSGSTLPSIVTFRINKTTGNIIGQLNVIGNNTEIIVKDVSQTGKFIVGYNFDPFQADDSNKLTGFVINLDSNGAMTVAKNFTIPLLHNNIQTSFNRCIEMPGGDAIVAGNLLTLNTIGGTGVGSACALRINSSLNSISWAKAYTDVDTSNNDINMGSAESLKITTDGNVMIIGANDQTNEIAYAIKLNPSNGNSGTCRERNQTLTDVSNLFTYSTSFAAGTENGPIVLSSNNSNYPSPTSVIPTNTLPVVTNICTLLGIENYNNETNIKIYPNPFADYLKIDLPKGGDNAILEIYNSLGQQVLNEKLNNQFSTVKIGNINSGLFFIKVTIIDKNNEGKSVSRVRTFVRF